LKKRLRVEVCFSDSNDVYLLASSGTGGMEAADAIFFRRDTVITSKPENSSTLDRDRPAYGIKTEVIRPNGAPRSNRRIKKPREEKANI
jgi:aspartate aminotransferase-like enzyme